MMVVGDIQVHDQMYAHAQMLQLQLSEGALNNDENMIGMHRDRIGPFVLVDE